MSSTEARRLRTLRQRAIYKQKGACYWCSEPMSIGAPDSDPKQATGDHLIPLHAGGQTVPGNIVAACRKCNNERHPDFKPMGGGLVATTGEKPSTPMADALVGLGMARQVASGFNQMFKQNPFGK